MQSVSLNHSLVHRSHKIPSIHSHNMIQIEKSGIDFLLQHIKRLDEKDREEAEGVEKALNVVENLLEVLPAASREDLVKADLLKHLVQMVARSPVEQNKYYASELLSILLTETQKAKDLMGTASSLEPILIALAVGRPCPLIGPSWLLIWWLEIS